LRRKQAADRIAKRKEEDAKAKKREAEERAIELEKKKGNKKPRVPNASLASSL
jgi:hypothetical protein